MRFGLALVVAFTPAFAGAALSPCVQDEIIREATGVVQIQVDGVERPDGIGDPDKQVFCPVAGTVERVFRGGLKVGDQVTFRVLCWSAMVGPGVIYSPEALENATKLEVHLSNGQPISRGPSLQFLEEFTDQIVWRPYCK